MTIATPGRRPLIVWDIVVSIVLMLGVAIFAFVIGTMGMFLAMASDGCGEGCNTGMITAGVFVAMFGPAVMAVVAMILAIVLMAKRRISFWIPLAGAGAGVLVWLLGFLLATRAVGW